MRKTLFVTAALVGLTAAGAPDARAQGSIADILGGRSSSMDRYESQRDPIAPILRVKRELNLTRTQDSRLRDIQRDLKRRNDELEKRIRRYDDDRRRDDDRWDDRRDNDRWDDRRDRDDDRYDGRYDNRRGPSSNDRDWDRNSRDYDAAVRQMRLNSDRAYQQARRVLTSTQQRRLDSIYRYGSNGRYDNDGRYDSRSSGQGVGRVFN